MPDRAILAGGIHPLKNDEHAVLVRAILQILQLRKGLPELRQQLAFHFLLLQAAGIIRVIRGQRNIARGVNDRMGHSSHALSLQQTPGRLTDHREFWLTLFAALYSTIMPSMPSRAALPRRVNPAPALAHNESKIGSTAGCARRSVRTFAPPRPRPPARRPLREWLLMALFLIFHRVTRWFSRGRRAGPRPTFPGLARRHLRPRGSAPAADARCQ